MTGEDVEDCCKQLGWDVTPGEDVMAASAKAGTLLPPFYQHA